MEKSPKFDSIQPRFLRYRTHYRIYLIAGLSLCGIIFAFWGHKLSFDSWISVYVDYTTEFWISFSYLSGFASVYFFWLRYRLNHSVQVFENHIFIHQGNSVEDIQFSEVESIGIVCWSIFYFKMKSGKKFYFNSSLERVDYIWDGIHAIRPDLFSDQVYESFRLKLVQYDHHQKRKEWFFRHKMVDIFYWIVLPLSFLAVGYVFQSRYVVINQQGLYFFRLFMYSLLVLMFTTFMYSMVLKKFIFDKRIKLQMNSQPDDKLRDIDFEGIILQRSKVMQMMTSCFIFAVVIASNVNLLSLTKIKADLGSFNIKKGQTLVVDNRYNCVGCHYSIKDGDVVMFGRGTIGQIMAREGDMVGQVSQDGVGRVIASENVQEVPRGHVAIKLPNNSEILIIKVDELIGRLQN